jgi:hypothetical protein
VEDQTGAIADHLVHPDHPVRDADGLAIRKDMRKQLKEAGKAVVVRPIAEAVLILLHPVMKEEDRAVVTVDGLAIRKDIQKLQNWDGNTVEVEAVEAATATVVTKVMAAAVEATTAAVATKVTADTMRTKSAVVVADKVTVAGSAIRKDIPKQPAEDGAAMDVAKDAEAAATKTKIMMTTKARDADKAVVMADGSEIRKDTRKLHAEAGEVRAAEAAVTTKTMTTKTKVKSKKIKKGYGIVTLFFT